jgi:heme A synthase
LPLALLHQIIGIVVLTIAVIHAERLAPQHASAVAAEPLGASLPRGTTRSN